MSLLLAITGWPEGLWDASFHTQAPGLTVQVLPESGDFSAIDRPAVRYVCAWKAPEGAFAGLPALEAVFSLGAGVDHLLNRTDLDPDIPIVRMADADLTGRMTEWVVFQVLLHHRQHLTYAAQQHQALWREHRQVAAGNLRVGVLGLGVLGADSAEALARLGFQVAGWSRTPKDIAGIQCFSGTDQLDAFLARTDILVCLLPATAATTGILNADLFARLSSDGPLGGPVLINAGRGALQVETDILEALESGTLRAASLDVFESEPLSPDSPLWRHERVVITPHVAASSDPEALTRAILRQIARHEAGKPLENVVDRRRGY